MLGARRPFRPRGERWQSPPVCQSRNKLFSGKRSPAGASLLRGLSALVCVFPKDPSQPNKGQVLRMRFPPDHSRRKCGSAVAGAPPTLPSPQGLLPGLFLSQDSVIPSQDWSPATKVMKLQDNSKTPQLGEEIELNNAFSSFLHRFKGGFSPRVQLIDFKSISKRREEEKGNEKRKQTRKEERERSSSFTKKKDSYSLPGLLMKELCFVGKPTQIQVP